MASEIELKLLLPGADPDHAAQVIGCCPTLKATRPSTQWLTNRYYDTPAFTLREQRAALRLRQISTTPWPDQATTRKATPPHPGAQNTWWQTFKTAGISQGGLSQRGEWECAVPTGELNAQALQATPWATLDPNGNLFAQLSPCFETRCQRTTWRVQPDADSEIEVALDVGHIATAGRTQPMLELELELLSGPPQALFDLAHELGQHLAVLPCDVSKAERGYALAQDRAHVPANARPVHLKDDSSPLATAQQVLGEIYDQLTRNLAHLLLSDDPELVHQARVAWRRWHSACRLFRPWLPPLPDSEALRPLRAALGRLRDLDVACHDTLPLWAPLFVQDNPQRQAMVDDSVQRLHHASQQEHLQVRRLLQLPATGQAWLAHTEWLHGLQAHGTTAPHAHHWARARLTKLRHRLQDALEDLHHPGTSNADRHTTRLLAKRTRYSTEALASLLPKPKAKRWIQQATTAQQQLGNAQDLAQAAALLHSVNAAPEWQAFMDGVQNALLNAPQR